MSQWCDLSELPVEFCACRIHEKQRKDTAEPATGPAVSLTGRPFLARYADWCPSCEEEIQPGDLIVRDSVHGCYIHAEGGCR